MKAEELNITIKRLIQSPGNMQAFADLASPEGNWSIIDKDIKLPRQVGFAELECPACDRAVRLIYDKFAASDYEIPLVCPMCGASLICVGEFSGYTSEIHLEERT